MTGCGTALPTDGELFGWRNRTVPVQRLKNSGCEGLIRGYLSEMAGDGYPKNYIAYIDGWRRQQGEDKGTDDDKFVCHRPFPQRSLTERLTD